MVRKCVVSFLLLAFLSSVMPTESVSAQGGFAGNLDIDVPPGRSSIALAAGGVIVLTLMVVALVYLAKKHPSTPTEQPQEQKQEAHQKSALSRL